MNVAVVQNTGSYSNPNTNLNLNQTLYRPTLVHLWAS